MKCVKQEDREGRDSLLNKKIWIEVLKDTENHGHYITMQLVQPPLSDKGLST